ncbi:MAG: sigma-70 family RNA polymerase sigma factor, partial [Actinobacteria bacterium]|nr:sigma-70 family RNA polymerase sigma factor [Actinomycetota bacterium]
VLYESLAPCVIGYLRAQGVADPEDVSSEVFIGILAGAPSFDGDEDDFRRWVFTIVHHRIIDDRRARDRRPAVDSLDAGEFSDHEGPPCPSAEYAALENLGTEQAHRLLDDLTPEQSQVMALRVLADLPVRAVAPVLAKRPDAVRSLQRRAVSTLRRQLAVEERRWSSSPIRSRSASRPGPGGWG